MPSGEEFPALLVVDREMRVAQRVTTPATEALQAAIDAELSVE